MRTATKVTCGEPTSCTASGITFPSWRHTRSPSASARSWSWGGLAAMDASSICRVAAAICAVAWTISVMAQAIDIGFRHFFPAEIFLIMLASRCVAANFVLIQWRWRGGRCGGGVDVALWTPDYLSYVNSPRPRIYLQISDSNLDWGQGRSNCVPGSIEHPTRRPCILRYFGPANVNLFDALGPRLTEYVSIGHWIHRSDDSRANLGPHGLAPVLRSPARARWSSAPWNSAANTTRLRPFSAFRDPAFRQCSRRPLPVGLRFGPPAHAWASCP